ncbi:OLC1v1005520C1 [Oldenlandia corymbosa var. corymbosa]|uniref:Dirigent protein n=1 Tax=Oldenlandia corymbosa var. corymbosa TaxID=529605 RepID=A0AAV1DG28_OLDCO|nr:OLC1v1005520C1 [Oldenlandia corymbosa var. corymbosa]
MAPNLSVSSTINLCAILMLAMFSFTTARETKLSSLFIQNDPATRTVVAGPRDFRFGTIAVADDKITAGRSRFSREIARIQGANITSSLDGQKAVIEASIIFTRGKYNGSTLEVQGVASASAKVREYAVTGGTGEFRFAVGYATFENVVRKAQYSVDRLDITVRFVENLS